MLKLRGIRAIYSIFGGVMKFDPLEYTGRIRQTRSRIQRAMTYSIPVCVADYKTPAFYYSKLMDHRRKRALDCGISKVKYGIWNSNMIMKGIN